MITNQSVSADSSSLYYEVEFKGRKQVYYTNPKQFALKIGDPVIVEAERGVDLGYIRRIFEKDEIPIRVDFQRVRKVLAPASREDLKKLPVITEEEQEALRVCREQVEKHHLEMKVLDAQYQFDGNKLNFFFTADGRVDFRELVRSLAAVFRTRIELRQIGVRDEAKRIGGFGLCGKEYCCVRFLTSFEQVQLQMARDQQVANNPSKISGACGRLMCCLAYEEKFYSDALERYPDIGSVFEMENKEFTVVKHNVLKKIVYLQSRDGDFCQLSLEECQNLKLLRRPNNYETEQDDMLSDSEIDPI